MEYRTGTIGFSYPDWVGSFYPPKTRPNQFLVQYARHFDTVELDTTFHAIPPIERIAHWSDQVPNHFLFCPKTPRDVTHDHSLSAARTTFQTFLHVIRHFAHKLGPIVLQFPPSFTSAQTAHLANFLPEFPPDLRFAIEFRHPSWQTEKTFDLLHAANIAWIVSDPLTTDPFPLRPTADFAYLRFLGVHHQYETYTHERIDPAPRLATQIHQIDHYRRHLATVFALFTNDFAGHSPATANRFRTLVGLPITPTPATTPAQPSLF